MMDTDINIETYRLQSQDFTEMQDVLSGWDHEYRQISSGAFRGSLLHSQIGSLGIFHNRWECAIHYRGTVPEGTIGLAVTLTQTSTPIWNGQRMALDDALLQRSGEEAEYFSSPLWDSIVFAIPETELTQLIADITNDNPEEVLDGHDICHLSTQMATQVRQACITYLRAVSWSIERPTEAWKLPEIAQSIVELIARSVVDSRPQYGQKPILGRHRTLVDADPAEALIKEVAFASGFRQLGKLSRDYQKLFGELPSDTLQSHKIYAKSLPILKNDIQSF